MRNRINRLIAAFIVGLGVLSALPAGNASASTDTALPITSFYQIVVDSAHGHIFISQGSSSLNEIIVTNLAGQEVTTITGQDGVMGIALSPDGGTLYAALSSNHAVTAIDTTTLQQTASYPLGDANIPLDVAVQSGKVWVSYDTGTVGASTIGDIDLSAVTPAFETQAAMGGWYSAPELAGDPQGTGVLVAVEPGESPAAAASYNVTVDPATVLAQSASLTPQCDNEGDLAVVPGGSGFILACGAPYAHYRYSTADLSEQGSYASTNYPDAVAIDAAGDVAAGTGDNPYSPDLYIYKQGGDTALNTFSLDASGANLLPRGLAWAPDGSQLFAVLQNSDSTYSLQVIDGPTLIQPSLSLTGPATAYINKPVTLKGALAVSSGPQPPAGTPITIVRSAAGGGAVQDFTANTAADGSFTLTDTPPALGQYTYTASYSGTATIAPATVAKTVTVTLIRASLTLTTGPTTRTYEPTVHLTAHLGTTNSNRSVSIYAETFGSTTKTLLKTGKVNSKGELTVSHKTPHSTTFSVVFSGDADYAARTVTHAVRVRAKVSESQSGYYGSNRVGRTTYRLYHRTDLLHVHATVAPNKRGQCVEFEVQEYFQGAWQANVATPCVKLSSASKASAPFRLTQADIGYHYRVRADYIRNGTDTSNLSSDSAWQYLIVET